MIYLITGKVINVMKISTKGRYALRMLVDLTINSDSGFISLKDIADRQDISKKYLEQIVPLFNGSGILVANRGFQGGYKLAKGAELTTVAEILKITEGSIVPVSCLEGRVNQCDRCEECETLYVWEGLSKVISTYLEGITLKDIADKQRRAARQNDNIVLL